MSVPPAHPAWKNWWESGIAGTFDESILPFLTFPASHRLTAGPDVLGKPGAKATAFKVKPAGGDREETLVRGAHLNPVLHHLPAPPPPAPPAPVPKQNIKKKMSMDKTLKINTVVIRGLRPGFYDRYVI